METKIREILARVLEEKQEEIKAIDKEESLIELGVDSMNSIEIVVELEEEFGIEIDIEELTVEKVGTITGLMQLVKDAQ